MILLPSESASKIVGSNEEEGKNLGEEIKNRGDQTAGTRTSGPGGKIEWVQSTKSVNVTELMPAPTSALRTSMTRC